MSSLVNVAIHKSQFPEQVRQDLLSSLRARRVDHKFHYDSIKQTQKWLALHQAYSPSRNDADVTAIYDKSFAGAAAGIQSSEIQILGLGCGGGQKDTRLARLLREQGREVFYIPCDVSAAMVLTARETALGVLPEDLCVPMVFDLARMNDLSQIFAQRHPAIVTFFGMIPNFEPDEILPKLASLIRSEDRLLFSANLAPGKDYNAGVVKILPQYDNPETRDWLMTFLTDLGVESSDGSLNFDVETIGKLKRVVAHFTFSQARTVAIDSERFEFRAGESIRLFFSYRYTPALMRETLTEHGLSVKDEWISQSGEEGVFLCARG